MSSLETLTGRTRDMLGPNSGLGYKVKIDLGEDGIIFVDGTTIPNGVSNEDGEADCTLRVNAENYAAMLDGSLSGTFAYMTGKLKVDGSMGVALKLAGMME